MTSSTLRPPIIQRDWILQRALWTWIERTARQGIHGRILDVGCGSKPYRSLFAGSNQYLGLDLPPERDIPRSAERIRATRGAVDVYGSALNLPFATESFDAVVSFQVLEHVPEPRVALSEMARVLSPTLQDSINHLVLARKRGETAPGSGRK